MKTNLSRITLLLLVLLFSQALHAQSPRARIGTAQELTQRLQGQSNARGKNEITLQLPSSESFTGEINKINTRGADKMSVFGKAKGVERSSYSLHIDGNDVKGEIVFPEQEKAFKLYSDPSGAAYSEEVDINTIICIDYGHEHEDDGIEHGLSDTQQQEDLALANSSSVLSLQSLPSATGVIYLDADGEYVSGTRWNGGSPIDAANPNLTDATLRETWEVVAEDFRPLNINVTTDRSVFDRAPKNRRMMVIITPTTTAAPGAGGVAYVNSFAWNDDTPCWAFITRNGKSIGEVSSHEAGHTLGLRHDGRTSPQEDYFRGHGNWAPIMGVGYYESITQWSRGEYAYANNTQDDLGVMAGTYFGVGLRADDNGGTNSAATQLQIASNGSVSASANTGYIERSTDVDAFRFTTSGGTVNIRISPVARHANLDILVNIYNGSGQLVTTIDPSGVSAAVWNTTVASGTYYIHVSGTGEGNPQTNGYSDYGSLGEYSISGTIPVSGTGNQLPAVSITSPSNNASFTAPASVTITASASDPDGSVTRVEFFNGSTKLGESTSSPWTFSWTNVSAGSYTLTARATDNQGATATSSAITVNVTSPVCNVPTGLAASNITSTSATLNWQAASGAQSYLLWYRAVGTAWSTENSVTVESNSYNLTGLTANTDYEFTLRSNCSDQTSGYASPYGTFKTGTPVVRGPFGGTAWPVPGKIEAENYDIGGINVAYADNSAGNSGGVYRTDDVDIESTTDAGGGFNVGWILNGEWLEYTTNVTASGRYRLEVRVASINSDRTFNILMDGQDISGTLSVPNTGGWQNWQTVTVNDISLSAGQKIMRIAMNGDGFNINHVTFSPMPNAAPVVSITSPSDNASFSAPADIAISASASDSDGTIASVEFFNGSTKLGERTSAPYTFTWAGVAAGAYQLTARATDNNGAVTTSSVVTVNITTAACEVPSGLIATNITSNSAQLTWTAASGAQSYLLYFRIVGTAWSSTNSRTVQTNALSLTDLQANTEYEFTLRSNCSDRNSGYATPYVRFTTGSGCDVPVNLQAVMLSSSSAELSWNPATGAESYNLWIRVAGGTWTSTNSWDISRTTVSVSGLQTGREYEFRVRTNCSGQTSAYSNTVGFGGTMAIAEMTDMEAGADIVMDQVITSVKYKGGASVSAETFRNAPNPFAASTEIQFDLNIGGFTEITIEDQLGNTVAVPVKNNLNSGSHKINVDLSELSSGMYICRINVNGEVRVIKMLKQ